MRIFKTAYTDRLDGQTGDQNVGEGFLFTDEPLEERAVVIDAKTTRYIDKTPSVGPYRRDIDVPHVWHVVNTTSGNYISKGDPLPGSDSERVSLETLFERGL